MDLRATLAVTTLVAVIGGTWGWACLQSRRLRAAVTEAAARLNGRYVPGGHFSGGTLYGKCDGRDIAFMFHLSHSHRSESTDVAVILKQPAREKFKLKGRDAVAREPRLDPYSRRFAPAVLETESMNLTLKVYGVVRDANRLVELASILSALAAAVETP